MATSEILQLEAELADAEAALAAACSEAEEQYRLLDFSREVADAKTRRTKEELEVRCRHSNEELRELAAERDNCLLRGDEMENLAAELRDTLASCEARFKTLDRDVAPILAKTQYGMAGRILVRSLQINVARELRVAEEGRVLMRGNGKPAEVRICASTGSRDGMLTWGRPHVPRVAHHSEKLRNVIRIDYGVLDGRFAELFPSAAPWLCFSLHTCERSFDFECPDEDTVQCFVLAVSRLTGVMYNDSSKLCCVAGGARSRGHFLATRGWCKLGHFCMARQTTVAKRFLETVRQMCAVRSGATMESDQLNVGPTDSSFLPTRSCGSTAGKEQAGCVARASMAPIVDIVLSASPPSSSCPPKRLPRAGEIWTFTGVCREVDVYRDAEGMEWDNQFLYQENSGVTIEETVKHGQPLAKVRGIGKLRFVRGWIYLVDAEGAWVIEKGSVR